MNAFTWGRLQDLVSCIYFVFDDENLRCSTMIYSCIAYLNRTDGNTNEWRQRKREREREDAEGEEKRDRFAGHGELNLVNTNVVLVVLCHA